MIQAKLNGWVSVRLTKTIKSGKKTKEIYLGSVTPEFFQTLLDKNDLTIKLETDWQTTGRIKFLQENGLLKKEEESEA